MWRYLTTAARYRWLLVSILGLVWGAGLAAAYVEYTTTFESEATIWVLRASPELTVTSPDDPSAPILQTAASQQADLLDQLLQTQSFVRDVVQQTSLRPALQAAPDDARFLARVAKAFHVQTHGTNLLTVAYVSGDPRLAAEMVNAALAVRADRVAQASVTYSAAANTLYQLQFKVAQRQALDAQSALDEFDQGHPGPLSDVEQAQRGQLRLSLDFAQVRLGNIKGRIDQSTLAPAVLAVSGMEFQVVDQPRVESSPRGGTKTAATTAAVAFVAGAALAALLVLLGTILPTHATGPADVARLAPVKLLAAVPRVPRVEGPAGAPADLRASLALIAFRGGRGRGDVTE
ncbi:MAG TPA: hypothetical protein VGR46_00850 [Candidatus Limnocylindria bacterium]|jgi:uncharacterized protein involved in exopolysaccharide biosynthesis|nr:hypothetical protein [Candidatus Limnocylindria bacterium]